MKVVLFIVLGVTASFFSFRPQGKVGKALFDQNCKSCHSPNKTVKLFETVSALSFQNIRKDYGLDWTVNFIQNNYRMHNKKDIRTLYSYYMFGKSQHVSWPQLEQKYIVKILDYVDSYPSDPTQYKHRLASEAEKLAFVKEHLLRDTVTKISSVDTAYQEIDTSSGGRSSRRRAPRQQ